MRTVPFCSTSLAPLIFTFLWSVAHSQRGASQRGPSIAEHGKRNSIGSIWDSASPLSNPESARAIHDASFLPARIGGIVAAYGVSLVLVAITLLSLAKKRREHLEVDEEIDPSFAEHYREIAPEKFQDSVPEYRFDGTVPLPHLSTPHSVYYAGSPSYIRHSRIHPAQFAPGIDPSVDQTVIAADKAMAQQQLEEMYRHVMEDEEARERGDYLEKPLVAAPFERVPGASEKPRKPSSKGKHKPSNLDLNTAKGDKSQSKASALFSALLSPKKKSSLRGVNISSPIMTPMSASFSQPESREMNAIPSRHYVPHPPPPPPVSVDPINTRFGASSTVPPDLSPQSIQTIDERIGLSLDRRSRSTLQAPSELDCVSAVSEHSQVPLLGLPSSPRLGGRFPPLPASPKPGSTFQRPSPVSAVRANGALPLRAYAEENGTPSLVSQTTKQTVFERKEVLSPSGLRTPFTANTVPYSPYQPFTPCIPVTPSLVTKEDRKRMKKMVPKTPTMAMVQNADEIW